MVLNIVIGVGLLLVGLVAFIASRPGAFRIARSIVIDAPPERPFSLVNDFHEWKGWSPYEKLDPLMKKTFEGAPSGAGAVYSWSGNDKAGSGRITIEQSVPGSLVGLKLEFFKPFKATNQGSFTFTPEGRGTKVTWAMQGRNGFMNKAFSMIVNMDKLVGTDFERGLEAMKARVESRAAG